MAGIASNKVSVLESKLKQIESIDQYNAEWFTEAEKRINALEGELLDAYHTIADDNSNRWNKEKHFPLATELAKQEKP